MPVNFPINHLLADEAERMGVSAIVIPAVHRTNFARVQNSRSNIAIVFTLGIHPMYVPTSGEQDLELLRETVAQLMHAENGSSHPRFLGIGEIGLDFFVPALCESPCVKNSCFYSEQLKIARDFNLLSLTHVRKSARSDSQIFASN